MSSSDHTTSVDSTTGQRFFAKVRMTTLFDCWLWIGSKRGQYGEFMLNGHKESAHRAAWIIQNGPIPDGLCVLHSCDNPMCVNPSHLSLGTQLDNMHDKMVKGRANVPRGSATAHAKLTEADIQKIRSLLAAGHSQRDVARIYGVSQPAICKINRHAHWKHVVD